MPPTLSGELPASIRADILTKIAQIPTVRSLGIVTESLAKGECVMSMPRDGRFDGIFVSLHGGIMMTLADTAACFAIQTLIGTEDTLTTTDMNIRFLAPALGECVATARVIKAGRTLCPTEIRLTDRAGNLLAIAQVTYMRLPKKLDRTLPTQG